MRIRRRGLVVAAIARAFYQGGHSHWALLECVFSVVGLTIPGLDVPFFPVFFFFSSRRRHTRCGRDWSSDVCSSDLMRITLAMVGGLSAILIDERGRNASVRLNVFEFAGMLGILGGLGTVALIPAAWEIGRASCRERV